MYTVKQTAEKLNVSLGLVYKLVQSGKLRAHKIGSAIRISDEDLQDFLREAVGDHPSPTFTHLKI